MPGDIETFPTAYFYLDLTRQTPANPDLIERTINKLGQVEAIPLVADPYGSRYAVGGLLLQIDPQRRGYKSVVIEAATNSLGGRAADLGMVLMTVSHPDSGVLGENYTIFSYFEGRSDHPEKAVGGVLELYKYRQEIGVDSHYRQAAMAFLDVHSFETIRFMEEVNGNNEKPEIVSLTAMPLFVDRLSRDGFLKNDLETVVAAPDFGSFAKARELSIKLGKPLIFIDKERPKPHEIFIKGLYLIHSDGKVEKIDNESAYLKDKRVIFFDDSIDTGETSILISQEVKKRGAKQAIFTATHAIFSDPIETDNPIKTIQQALDDGDIDYLYTTDSLPFYKKVKHNHYKIVSVSGLFASLIKIAADKAVEEDYDLVSQCLYNPITNKKEIEKYFREGNVSRAFEGFDYYDGIFGNRGRVVFSRQPAVN